jgi:hypothetical protein
MLIASIVEALRSLFTSNSYGSKLEDYIISHNPKSVADVEYLTRQYDYKMLETEQCHKMHCR